MTIFDSMDANKHPLYGDTLEEHGIAECDWPSSQSIANWWDFLGAVPKKGATNRYNIAVNNEDGISKYRFCGGKLGWSQKRFFENENVSIVPNGWENSGAKFVWEPP